MSAISSDLCSKLRPESSARDLEYCWNGRSIKVTVEEFPPTPSNPDDDPYLWLEEKESAAALA
jgi:hypothetical protein